MADLERLLERTSRTFALNIPYLPEPTRGEVTIAYLLFRIADTFEDSVLWTREERVEALDRFSRLLSEPDPDEAANLARRWCERPPLDHEGYMELLAATPAVLDDFGSLSAKAVAAIREHVVRTAEGMSGFVERSGAESELRLRDIQDLRDYCYAVAGIVGEMLTVLFLLGRPALEPVAERLRSWAPLFGEGLQLTNILKDVRTDTVEGRRFLPEAVDRERIFELATDDLERAVDYTLTLQDAGVERGLVIFNALPVAMARATLAKVASSGPGSKITRPEVWRIVSRVERAFDRGRPVLERGPVGSVG